MGYTTDFEGTLKLSRDLTVKETNYINKFSYSRRMGRDISKLLAVHKGKFGALYPTGNSAQEIYGNEGEYYIGDDSVGVLDNNIPPNQARAFSVKVWEEKERRIKEGVCQPGLWCQWVINEDNELEWDGGEKFYYYTEWLKYMIIHFFGPWGVKLNGEIQWQGEGGDDVGKIVVKENVVSEKKATFED